MGSAASADARKQRRKQEKINEKAEKALKRKLEKRERLLKNHEDYDEEGNPFFYDGFGEVYYLDDDLVPYYLDEEKRRYYFDKNRHKFYLDERGRPYHVDHLGERCSWDEMGNPFYIGQNGERFYRDYDRQVYYLDEEGMPYYFDELNNKTWIRLDLVDENGRVITRTKSRKAMKEESNAKITGRIHRPTPLSEIGEEVARNSEISASRSSAPTVSETLPAGTRRPSLQSRATAESAGQPARTARSDKGKKYPTSKHLQPKNSTSTSASSDLSSRLIDTTLSSSELTSRSSTTSSQLTVTTLTEDNQDLPAYRNLTPEYDKYPDISDEEDITPEQIAKVQLDSDRRILSKILAAEKEKGILPPRKTFRKVGHYSVKEKSDTKDCSITGSAFLPNGNLVVSDFHNKNLKMYDPDLKFVTDLKLDAYPENMCARAQDFDIYVPFKAGMQYGIKVVKVTDDTMSLIRTIQTKGLCYGICSNNGGLAVIVNTVEGWQIHLLDLKGNIKKRLTIEVDDKPLLKRPDYLAVTRDLRLLISDRGANAVLCFDIWSEEVFFEYKNIREPYGVSCDNKGSIFVTSPGGVYQISTTGERIAALMKREDIGFSPTCACYDLDDALLVLTGQSNQMAAFQLMDALSEIPDQQTKKTKKHKS